MSFIFHFSLALEEIDNTRKKNEEKERKDFFRC